jgi:tRNA C32,U32 (ribose-2'-O)-methylase TrmJ
MQVALILGNEVTGVDTAVLELCDKIIEIPTFGLKNSLNVASACPVVVFEVLRQWRAFPSLDGDAQGQKTVGVVGAREGAPAEVGQSS